MSSHVLVTGGSGSGKSAYAEELMATESQVTYVAPGAPADPERDPEWAARAQAHQDRRPAHWTTVETLDLTGALRAADSPVLIDCLGTWLTGWIDERSLWEQPVATWQPQLDAAVAELVEAWTAFDRKAVVVTNEVGWGLVSEHHAGRLFTRLLGRVNTAMAAASEDVILVVAGRALRI